MKLMDGIYLLLGTNLGEKEKNLLNAIDLLETHEIKVIKKSSVYETAAWGKTDQASFYNQVIQIETLLVPHALLKIILLIEKKLGRVRKEHWGERLIDIDILYFNNTKINTPELEIPHPGIPKRRFTLVPMVEIAEDFIHPIYLTDQKSLLKECEDLLDVHKTS